MNITEENQNDPEEICHICRKSDGFGMIADIYSCDTGKLGSSKSPAHARLFDTNMVPKGKFVITLKAPKKPSDVIWYQTDNPPYEYAENIVKWANASSCGVNNWLFAVRTWDSTHY